MSDDVIGRLRELADALPEPVKGLEQLGRASDLYLRRQERLSEQWEDDLHLLRAQTKALRDLRRELTGVTRVAGRDRRGPAAGLGLGGAGRARGGRALRAPAVSIAMPRLSGIEAAARRGARAYGRAFARRLGHSGFFLRAGRVAGRALSASTAATAAARAPRSFRARQRTWTAVGHVTGITIGLAGGRTAGSTMAVMTAASLFVEMKRMDPLVKAAGTMTGISFGTQAGLAAGAAFASSFAQSLANSGIGGKKDDDGGGLFGGLADFGGGVLGVGGDILGVGGDILGFGGGVVSGGAGVLGDIVGGVPGIGGPLLEFSPDMTDLFSGIGGGPRFEWGLKAFDALGGAFDAVEALDSGLGWAWRRDTPFMQFASDWSKTLPAPFGPAYGGNEIFGRIINFIQGQDYGPGGFIGDMITGFGYEANRWMKLLGHKARGGVVRSGEITLVGERGPEIVQLPAGSNVIPAHRTRAELERAATATAPAPRRRDLHIHQVLDGREIARATIRNIDDDEQWGRR